jgi:hypothetical protein
VFIDGVFTTRMRIELSCGACGKRWFIKRDGSVFSEWLFTKESERLKKSYIFI